MESKNFFEDKSSEKRIIHCLQDYANNFMALEVTFIGNKIEGVRNLFRTGYFVPTIEEYLKKYKNESREIISKEDQRTPLFIEKSKNLNRLASEINILGKNIEEKTINEIFKKVKVIVYSG